MTSRARRQLTPAALAPALGLALLSGCGTTHPGAAAVVDGTRIEMSDVDDAARALCAVRPAQQVADTAATRDAVLQTYISRLVVLDVAQAEGVEVPRSAWTLPAADREQITRLAPDDADVLIRFLERSSEAEALAAALGEDLDALIDAADPDVDVDPRFGIDETSVDLSALSDADAPASIPETQLCG